MNRKTLLILSLGINLALIIFLSISISEKNKLNTYAEYHLHNNMIEIGEQLKLLEMEFNKVNNESMDKKAFERILASYTTFTYEYVALERLGETLGRVSSDKLNHSAIFNFKNELHSIDNRFSKGLSQKDKQFFIKFKSFVKDLNENLNNNFRRFEVQTHKPFEDTYKIDIKGNKKLSDFDHEFKINSEHWVNFIKDTANSNSHSLN